MEIRKKLDLNVAVGYQVTDAIGKAKSYANNKGALRGRLLTYDEAQTLIKAGKTDMVYGKGNSQTYEIYWLGSSEGSYASGVKYVSGESSGSLGNASFGDSSHPGVRSVLTVFKSDVTAAR